MAVSLNSGGSYRANFMISDAAMPQRAQQVQVKQDDGFAKLLDSRSGKQEVQQGSVNSSKTANSVNSESAYQSTQSSDLKSEPKAELDRVCEVPDAETLVLKPSEEVSLISEDKAAIPEDTAELAAQIISGKIDLEDVPLEKLTFELLKEIVALKKLEFADDEGEEPDFTNPMVQSFVMLQFDLTVQITSFERVQADPQQILWAISAILEADSKQSLMVQLDMVSEALSQGAAERNLQMGAAENISLSENLQAAEQGAQAATDAQQRLNGVKGDSANAAEKAGIIEGEVVVRKVSQSEGKSDLSQDGAEQSPFRQQTSVSREISEELEMLKNAKLGKGRTDGADGGKTEQTAPVNTANPLTASSPIVMAGKDGEVIQIRPNEVISQVTQIVEQAIANNKQSVEYSMTLNPEELGRITVKLVKATDGAVSITIVAENANTQRLLEQHGELMQSNLRANGVQLQSWQTVNEAHQETMQREYDGSSKNPYYREENDSSDEEQQNGESFADIIAAM